MTIQVRLSPMSPSSNVRSDLRSRGRGRGRWSSEPVEEGHGSLFKLEVEKTEKTDLSKEHIKV